MTQNGSMSHGLLNEAVKIHLSGDDALREWFTELPVEKQLELGRQIKALAQSMAESWGNVIEKLNRESATVGDLFKLVAS